MESQPPISSQHIEAQDVDHTWFRQAELANMWTHLGAFCLGLFGFHLILDKSLATANLKIISAAVIYGVCVLFTFLASTIYHALTHPRLKEIFHFLDRFLIYLMIAGTYTPFTLVLLHAPWGPILFWTIWSLAGLGIIATCFFMRYKLRLLSTTLYVLIGWAGAITIVPIVQVLPTAGLFWMIGGGVIYTVGVFFYLLESVPFSHTIWHLFVIFGAVAQFICIYNYVIPNH